MQPSLFDLVFNALRRSLGENAPNLRRVVPCAILALVMASLMPSPAPATDTLPHIQKSARDTEAVRKNLVGIVTGGPSGVYAGLGNDLLRLLDDRQGGSLRLSVLIGSGSVNNLDDLWNLPGVSLAIVQGDVLAAYAADPEQFKWLGANIRSVSRLHTEVLHVITRKDVISRGGHTACALRGKRINVGGLGSGARITAEKVFNDILGLKVTIDPGSLNEAFDQLADGRVDAIAYVVGRPAPLFTDEKLAKRFVQANLDWLDVPKALLAQGCGDAAGASKGNDPYESVALTSSDYPALIREGRTVDTVGVPAVLAAYKFDDRHASRSAALSTFVAQFFARAADPDAGLGHAGSGYSRAWCGVDLAAPVGAWQRDETAAAWLAANGKAPHPLPTRIDCLVAAGASPGFCRSKPEMVNEFNRQQGAAGRSTSPTDPDYLFAFADWSRRVCR